MLQDVKYFMRYRYIDIETNCWKEISDIETRPHILQVWKQRLSEVNKLIKFPQETFYVYVPTHVNISRYLHRHSY